MQVLVTLLRSLNQVALDAYFVMLCWTEPRFERNFRLQYDIGIHYYIRIKEIGYLLISGVNFELQTQKWFEIIVLTISYSYFS